MYSDGPRRLKPDDLRLEAICPASSLPRRTRKPDNALTRWKATMEAVTQWYLEGTPDTVERIESDHFGALDPVQRELCTKAFRAWRDRVGKGGHAEFDVVGPSVEEGDAYMACAIQLALVGDDGTVENIKVKLRTPTSEDERAIITLGREPGIDYLEVILDPGQIDSLTIDPERAEEIVAELFAIGRMEFDRNRHVGGSHCFRCGRVSLCRQYPPLGDSPPASGTKSVTLGKGTLSHLGECPRRVAWKGIFQLPDDRSEFDETNPALAMGNQLHTAMAMALIDSDPDGVMRSHARPLAGSEQAEFLGLWDTHLALNQTLGHPVTITRTELPIGCTAPAGSGSGPVAVTFIGIVDAAGREADGTPALVEHRTTKRRDLPHLEQELYAVAGAMAVRTDRIAVHHHWLRSPIEEACTRRLFEDHDLRAARDSLVVAAAEVARWDREDATDAPFAVGDWCAHCPYETLCQRHRGRG